ncbi:hypothetical protein [Subtercola sp. YIM 133946]|uniref:hypothetical protein n=1 Tax=Subtercola sp. YIM 133946 TaxID=3118909 RepID=UPI002F9314BE
MVTTDTRVLVLDFDGTVCLGDAPVYAYARLLDEALAAQAGNATMPRVRHVVERYLAAGESGGVAGAAADAGQIPSQEGGADGQAAGATAAGPGAEENGGGQAVRDALEIVANSVDGYEAAERLARSRGIGDAQLSAAYAGSREELASGAIETTAPEGLVELLAGLPEATRVVLVTNAPETGVTQQLEHLGLTQCFDEVITSAGKPAKMGVIVQGLLDRDGLAGHPAALLSVGDIWRNDLAPAAALGCETALIERLAAPDARPTYRAATIEQLYPAIAAWAAESSASSGVTPEEKARAAFDSIAAGLLERPGVDIGPMFGSEGLRIRGKVFAFVGSRGALVVKVPAARADELAAEPARVVERMVMRQRELREWVTAGPGATERWAPLIAEAFAYVDSITP